MGARAKAWFVRFIYFILTLILISVVVALLSLIVTSPFVLLALCIMKVTKEVMTAFGGNYFYLWLVCSAGIFIPMMFYVVIHSIIENHKTNKAWKEQIKKEQK